MIGNTALTNIAIPLARDNLPGLLSNLTSNAKTNLKKEISGKGTARVGKRVTLYKDINDIIKIIKL